MTAPLFFVAPELLRGAAPGTAVRLTGPEGHHAARVRRLRAGEGVLLADGQGRRAETVVSDVLDGGLVLRVVSVGAVPEPSPRFVLVQALAKAGRDEQAVEAATELGVDEIVPWQAARSVVVWRGERADKGRRKWQSVVRAASVQARRVREPLVSPVVGSAELADRLRAAAVGLVLHEDADLALADVPIPGPPTTGAASVGAPGEVVVVVGPEGGVAPQELSLFISAGAVAVRLGSTVLRSSTAGPAALAVLSARDRWRGEG